VLEDWQPLARETTTNGHTLDDEVQDLEPQDMALPAWSGLFAGSERLVQLLRLIAQYLGNPTANPVGINISAAMDIVTRILSLTVPGSGGKAYQNTARLNNQVSKEERENLWLVLPNIHVAAIEVLLVLANRFQSSTLPLDSLVIDQMVATLLQRSGIGLSKSSVDSLVPLMRACCDDLLPLDSASNSTKPAPSQTKTNGISSSTTTANADTFLNSSKSQDISALGFLGLKKAACDLLPALLGNVRAQYLSDALRSRLDRTAAITQHKRAMVASVLNPPPSKRFGKPAASVLPLIARSFSASPDVEGMLRPRMPVIRLGAQDAEAENDVMDHDEDGDEEEEDEDKDEDEDEVEEGVEEAEVEDETMTTAIEDEQFMGHELDTILESEGRTDPAANDLAMTDAPATDARAFFDSGIVSQITKESGKRAHIAQVPSSPSKRVKTSEEEDFTALAPPSGTTVTGQISGTTLPQTSDFTVTSTASAVSDLPATTEEETNASDSEGDDVVSLVLGQDTDDESE
jgi:pre-rRNA-processing protein RIX1